MAFFKKFLNQNSSVQSDNNTINPIDTPQESDNNPVKEDNSTPTLVEPWIIIKQLSNQWFMVPYLDEQQRQTIVGSSDPVRYGTIFLALERIVKDKIAGSFAECGVYKGHLSKYIHDMYPDRKFYLFDTFEGFDNRDADSPNDDRFRDTSEEGVRQHIGNLNNLDFRKGYFPATATGIENEQFAFVMLDFDKYEPTLAGLKLFYPLISPGGYLFVHDYNSPESNWACSRALNEFLSDKPEKPISIPDSWGTALFRKV